MAQAPTYTRSTDFAGDERNNAGGRSTVRADKVSAEFDSASVSINALQANLELIQRDDGELRDGIVTLESISTAVAAMFGGSDFVPRGDWANGTIYAIGDLVDVSSVIYVCLVAHVASVFATDLAAGRWQLFPGASLAASTQFEPTDEIASTDMQSALVEVDTNARNRSLALLALSFGGF